MIKKYEDFLKENQQPVKKDIKGDERILDKQRQRQLEIEEFKKSKKGKLPNFQQFVKIKETPKEAPKLDESLSSKRIEELCLEVEEEGVANFKELYSFLKTHSLFDKLSSDDISRIAKFVNIEVEDISEEE